MTAVTARPTVSIVVAIASGSRAICEYGKLLFHISDDLKRFRRLTTNHPVIMGRKTYESIGRPLPERTNFVITRNSQFKAPGCIVCTDLNDAIEKAINEEMQSSNEKKEVFIIGGGEIYSQGLPRTNKIYLTSIESDKNGDAHFPDYSDFKREVFREDHLDEKTGLKYSWIDLER